MGVALSLIPGPAYAGIWTSFTRAEGLDGDAVTAITPSDSGTIFIATNEFNAGQNRSEVLEYDGVRFVSLSSRYAIPPDYNGVTSSCPENPGTPSVTVVSSIALAPNGDVWVGTSGNGVFRLGPTDFDHYTLCDGLGQNNARGTLVETDGTVWVATVTHPADGGGGISRFDGTSWNTILTGDGVPLGDIIEFALAADGSVWMTHGSSGGGLTRYNGTRFDNFQRPGGPGPNQLWRLAIARDGAVWVSSQASGVGVFDAAGNWLRDFTTADGLVTNTTRGMAAGPHGDIWTGTIQGVQRWDGAGWGLLDASDGLVSNQTGAMRVAPAGVLWVGTAAGMSRYEGSLWLTLGRDHGLAALQVNDLSRGPLEDMPPGPYAGGVTKGPIYAAVSRALNGDPLFDPLGGVARITGLDVEMVMDGGGLLEGIFTAVAAEPGGTWTASRDSFYRIQGLSIVEREALPPPVENTESANSLVRAGDGTLWAGTQDGGGTVASVILRRTGGAWGVYDVPGLTPTRDGVIVHDINESGQVWVSTFPGGGAARVNPTDGSHVKYTVADGLPSNEVPAVLVASNGDVWFGTVVGVARLRGSTVSQVPGTGLLSDNILSLGEDESGRIWAGTTTGAAYFDGTEWVTYSEADGLANITVWSLVADTQEALLGTSLGGLSLFRTEAVAPHAAIKSGPPRTLGGRAAAFEFTGGDLDSRNEHITLSWSLDGGTESPFSKEVTANIFNLADGDHAFLVRSRDRALNISLPAQYMFEVDATPPQPVLASPTFGQPIAGTTPIIGVVADERFGSYLVEVSPAGDERDWVTIGSADSIPPLGEPLATWDTETLPDGDYVIRLAVTDTLNLTGYGVVGVIIDNEAPGADVTTPARINNASGGRIYTLNAEVEAYFPPQSLDQDRVVTIQAIPESSPHPPGAGRWLGGWGFSPAEFQTKKRVTLTFSLAALDSVVQAGGGTPIPSPLSGPAVTAELGIFAINPDSSYSFLGGSVDPNLGTITTTIQRLSAFAVFEGFFDATTSGGRDVDIQPRAFSPRGNTFDTKAAISFNLNDGANVRIYVHDRSGRIVRRVFDGSLGPGRNVVDWDGRDGNGSVVPSGVYLVTVKAGGATDVKSVAVVNR
jgi:ligand-binding sensor domain-containing protein